MRERGSVLLIVTVLVVLVGGIVGAFAALSLTYHRASDEYRQREEAYQAARTGANYFLAELASDRTYLDGLGTTLPTITMGDYNFEMESLNAATVSGFNMWTMTVVGRSGDSEYRLGTAMGYGQSIIPGGVTIGGSGDPNDVALSVNGSSRIGSYDPSLGFDSTSLSENAEVSVDGSVDFSAGTVMGFLEATGAVSGTATLGETAGATLDAVDSVDPAVTALLDYSRTSNDNSVLSGIFGTSFTPIADGENYGDLIVSGGEYVVPAGTYRFRRFEVTDGARIVFDNSTGPTNLVYIGGGTEADNDLTVSKSSFVGLENLGDLRDFRTVLSANSDFVVSQGSVYGQNTSDPDSGGHSQIISLGGDGTADEFTISNGSAVYGRVHAMAHDIFLASNGKWFGSGAMRSLAMQGGTGGPSGFFVDEEYLGRTVPNPEDFVIAGMWSVQ